MEPVLWFWGLASSLHREKARRKGRRMTPRPISDLGWTGEAWVLGWIVGRISKFDIGI